MTLQAIATSLGLILERPAGWAPGFAECPGCGTCYDSSFVGCEADGRALTKSSHGRLLSRRYRLDRRLGRGGMGTVYEAADSLLERRVAVKVIREDWLASADAVGAVPARSEGRRQFHASARRDGPRFRRGRRRPGLPGTLAYMSPEQRAGHTAAESWDVWALTVMAFEMLTGVHPVTVSGDPHMAVVSGFDVTRHAPATGLSAPVEAFFERALSIEVSLRPASVRQLVQELEMVL